MPPSFDCPLSEDNARSTPSLRAHHCESSPHRLVGEQGCPRHALGAGVPFYLDVLCLGPEEPCPN